MSSPTVLNLKYGNFSIFAHNGIILSYLIEEKFFHIAIGQLYLLPFNKTAQKLVVGIFLGFCAKPNFACLPVHSPMLGNISFSQEHLSLFYWLADYYLSPLNQALALLIPSFIWKISKHKLLAERIKNFAEEKEQKIRKELCIPYKKDIDLNPAQNNVYLNIINSEKNISLLYGVTGAGKTEIYLKLAQKFIAENKQVLILVPEIVLTPQMSARFRAVFGNILAVLHSGLTQKDYMKEWLKIYFNAAKIILGVRTAIFCPLQNLGIIIVDEEHDSSYKSSNTPCFNARDIAVMRAKMLNARCVLGSATPSLESLHNVTIKKYNYISITQKFSGHSIESQVINAKEELDLKNVYLNTKLLKASAVEFSQLGLCAEIIAALKENKQLNQQSMLIVNRRGYINYALCAACALPLLCPNCSVSTTLHAKATQEICHYCNYSSALRKKCPQCGQNTFLFKGIGTQHIEEKLQQYLPELKIARLDRDVLTSNTRLTSIINNFRNGEIDCLIGTQLLAKGHDFAKVTLVVILHIEDSLFIPDFRASERTFQLLIQAMGRVGRGQIPGKVLLQSFLMHHPIIEFALHNDIDAFVAREEQLRQLAWLPPFSRQILFEITHKNLEKGLELSASLAQILTDYWHSKKFSQSSVRISGPYQATIAKINKNFRIHICVTFAKTIHPKNICPQKILLEKQFLQHLRIDVDPITFL